MTERAVSGYTESYVDCDLWCRAAVKGMLTVQVSSWRIFWTQCPLTSGLRYSSQVQLERGVGSEFIYPSMKTTLLNPGTLPPPSLFTPQVHLSHMAAHSLQTGPYIKDLLYTADLAVVVICLGHAICGFMPNPTPEKFLLVPFQP